MIQLRITAVFLGALTLMFAGCTDGAAQTSSGAAALTVHKTPTCGCCGEWVEHMRQAGFETTVFEVADLTPTKEAVGLAGEGAKIRQLLLCHHHRGISRRTLQRRPGDHGLYADAGAAGFVRGVVDIQHGEQLVEPR